MTEPNPGKARYRDVLAIATLWIPFIAVVVTWLFWRDALPDEMPKQWDADGVSSTAPTWIMLGVTSLASFVAALVATLALYASAAPSRRSIFLGTGFVAGLASSAWLVTGSVTVIAGGTSEPNPGGWPLLAILASGYGAIPYLLSPKWIEDSPLREPVEIELAPSEVGAWSKTITVPLFAWVGLIVVAGSVVLLITMIQAGVTGGTIVAGFVMLFVLGFMLAFVRLHVSVDWRGLRVVSSILRVPLKSAELVDIESVHTDILDPVQWGGWGYRIMPGRSAIILRRGPGLVLNLTNGKQFAVSLDEPETPTVLLMSLRASAK